MITKFTMTEARRNLMHTVMDDKMIDPTMLQFMEIWNDFIYCDNILRYLVNHKIKGQKLLDWIGEKKWTPIALGQFIVMKINKDTVTRPWIGGKNFLV